MLAVYLSTKLRFYHWSVPLTFLCSMLPGMGLATETGGGGESVASLTLLIDLNLAVSIRRASDTLSLSRPAAAINAPGE